MFVMKNKKVLIIAILSILLPIVFFATKNLIASIEVSSSSKIDFVLNKSFEDTLTILITEDITKNIIEASGDEILESKIDKIHLVIDGIDPLICRGEIEKTLKVMSKSDDLEDQILILKQKIEINYDEIVSTTILVVPSENIKQYLNVTRFRRTNSNKTAVLVEKGMTIKHESNSKIVKRIIQSKLDQFVIESTELAKQIIKEIEKQEVLPIFGN